MPNNNVVNKVIEIKGKHLRKKEKSIFKMLFIDTEARDLTLQAFLNGKMGRAFAVFSEGKIISAAIMCMGFVYFFKKSDVRILSFLKTPFVVMAANKEWSDLIKQTYPHARVKIRHTMDSSVIKPVIIDNYPAFSEVTSELTILKADNNEISRLVENKIIQIDDFPDEKYLFKNGAVFIAIKKIWPGAAQISAALNTKTKETANINPASESYARKIAGIAWTTMICPKVIEVSIFVKKSYRRKGLAFRLSADLINWSINNGLTPNWDAANRASKKLALKLGYVWQSDYRTLLVK